MSGNGRLSAGSVAGAGNYVLGANELTVGSTNLSTEMGGAIFGSGTLAIQTPTTLNVALTVTFDANTR